MRIKTLCFIFLLANIVSGQQYRYELSICAIFRDEAPYLKEWIEFHKLVGAEHFYLFNHLSVDDYQSELKEYIDQGIVELFDWPYHANSWEHWLYEVQAKAYENCIIRSQGETKWLAIIDIDEFLTPMSSDTVLDVLKDYEEFGGVGFNWKLFGTSGFLDLQPNKLLIESLIMTAPMSRPTHLGVKSIIRPERVLACNHPHYVVYQEGFYHVNSNKDPYVDHDGMTNGVYYDRLVINHYYTRTGRYFYKKMQRWKKFNPDIVPENWCLYSRDMNVVEDHSMDRFIAPLRERMQVNNP